MKIYLHFHCILFFVTEATWAAAFFLIFIYLLIKEQFFRLVLSFPSLLHTTSSQSEAQWSKWWIRMKKAQHKVWGGRSHLPKLQLTPIPFTICPCFLIWELWWFLRSDEWLQVKFTWTDVPQTKWDHILCKLCIQRLWFLYCWLIVVVWKTATPNRKSSSDANLSSVALALTS